MGKHSKNNCALPYYTYAERTRDAKRQGYGTRTTRISKDSVKDFDACWLTLQPCRDPVITPHGYLFEREAIYEYILHEKAEIAQRTRAYEAELERAKRARRQRAEEELEIIKAKQAVEEFAKIEYGVSATKVPERPKEKILTPEDVKARYDAKEASLKKNFWIPANTPEVKVDKAEKPDQNVYCPISGKKLKAKDLIPVKFTPVDKAIPLDQLLKMKERWVCPISMTTLTNATPCVVLKPSGAVITQDAYNNVVKKDMVDPISGDKLREEDVIPLIRGGTGFAGAGVDLQPKTYTPALQAS